VDSAFLKKRDLRYRGVRRSSNNGHQIDPLGFEFHFYNWDTLRGEEA
jgi:hypothetical protein